MPEIPIKYLKYIDNTGNVQKAYGITVLKAVYDADGNTLDEILQTYDNKVGDTSSLTTTANTDLVSAINEVDGNVGDLSGLSTTAKNNLVAAVNELNQKMNGFELEYIVVGQDPVQITFKEIAFLVYSRNNLGAAYFCDRTGSHITIYRNDQDSDVEFSQNGTTITLTGTYQVRLGIVIKL